jgi:hypothetical protein
MHSVCDLIIIIGSGFVTLYLLMKANYRIFGPLNLHLLNLYLYYFIIFLVSFGVLQVFEKKMLVFK